MDDQHLENANAEKDNTSLQIYFDKNKFSELGTEVIQQIYCNCNVDNSNSVRVSKLLEFIATFIDGSSIELSPLRKALDPTDINPAVDQVTFSDAFAAWIFDLNQNPTLEKHESIDSGASPNASDAQNKGCEEEIKQLKFENKQLKSQLELFQTQLLASDDENNTLSNQNTKLKNKLDEVQQLFNNLKIDQKVVDENVEECIKLNAKIKTLEESSTSRQKEIVELHLNLEIKENKIEQLESDVKCLNNNIKEKEKRILKLQQDVDDKENTITTFNDFKNTLDDKIIELEDLLQHYKEENEYLKSGINNKQCLQTKPSKLILEKPEHDEENPCKQSSNISLCDTVYQDAIWTSPVTDVTTNNILDKELSKANKELLIKEYHSVISQQKLTIAQLVKKIKHNLTFNKDGISNRSTATDLNSLELKVIDLEADSNKKYIRIVDLMEQKEQLQKQLTATSNQRLEENKVITEENRKLKAENDQVQMILLDLKVKKCELESEIENLKQYCSKCNELENNLNNLLEEKSVISKNFDEVNSKNLDLEKIVDNLYKANEECIQENIHLKEQIKNLKEERIEYLKDNNKSETLLKKEKQVKILEKMVDYQNLELKALSIDKKRHLDQIYELKCNYDKLTKQVKELNNQLDDSVKAKETLSSEVKFLNKLNENLQIDLQRVSHTYDNFQASFCTLEEYNFVNEENKSIKAERDRMIKENKELNNKSLKTNDQILCLIEKTDHFSYNLVEIKSILQNYKQVIAKLKQNVKNQKHKTHNKLEDEYIKKINHLEDTNLLLQMKQHDLREELNMAQINCTILNKEKERWALEKRELNDAKERLTRDLEQNCKEKKQIELQLHKKSQMVCEHCMKLHKEKEELHKHIKDLQYEIGLLEKEIYAPKKGNFESTQSQLDKLKINLEITNQLLQHEKQNNELFKQENTKLLIDINEIKNQTLQEKVALENQYKETTQTLNKQIENLQAEKILLHNNNLSVEQELESCKKKNVELQNQVAELFAQNDSLEKKLDEVVQELKDKTNISIKLQADLQEEEVLLELFHQKSILFQQNIDTVYNQKSILERKLHKAISDLQKSENKYLSIRKLLVDTQSHVSGDFKNVLQSNQSEDKIINLECTLKNCQEELSNVKLKCAESVMSFNAVKERMGEFGTKIQKSRKRLNKSVLTLVRSWHEMLEKVIDIQLILDNLDSNESSGIEDLDDEILKLENEIHLVVQFLNALSTYKFPTKTDDYAESFYVHSSKFVKKLTFKSTTTKIEHVSSEPDLPTQHLAA